MKELLIKTKRSLRLFFVMAFASNVIEAQTPVTYTGNSYYSGAFSSGNQEKTAVNGVVSQFTLNGNAGYTIKAKTAIHINTPTTIDYRTSGTTFNAYLSPSSILDLASFHPNGWSNIGTYSRFEIGVNIPLSIQTKFDNYLSNITPGGCNSSTCQLNPYDPEQVLVKCTFYGPTNTPYVRYGFYYKDYYVNNNVWTPTYTSTPYPFRIRFAPPEAGAYSGKVELYTKNPANGQLELEPYSVEFVFNTTTSAEKGHVTVSPTVRSKLVYPNGDIFYALGQNIPYAKGIFPNVSLPAATQNTAGFGATSDPAKHDEHRSYIQNLYDNDGNFVRMRFDQISVPLIASSSYKYWSSSIDTLFRFSEFNLLRNLEQYHDKQPYLWEMDKTIALCESKKVKIMLCILLDTDFCLTNDYGGLAWKANPFSSLLNYKDNDLNNRSLVDLKSFFTDQAAKNYYKKMLFYIMARWGYSTSIGMWEMINETENLAKYGEDIFNLTNGYYLDSGFQNDVANWVCEMKTFMELGENGKYTFYPLHPFTNGTTLDGLTKYPNPEVPGDTVIVPNINSKYNCLNIYSVNNYNSFIREDYKEYYNWDDVRHRGAVEYFNQYRPFIFGELGLWIPFPDQKDDRHFHNANWTSAMGGGIGAGLYFYDFDQKYGIAHRANFKALKSFFDQVNLSQSLFPIRFGGVGGQNRIVNSNSTKSLYNYYMRNANSDYFVGWVMNGASFWANNAPSVFYEPTENYNCPTTPDNCAVFQNQGDNYNYLKAITNFTTISDYDVSTDVNVEVVGVIYGQTYQVTIYNAYGNGGILQTFYTQGISGGRLSFNLDFSNHFQNGKYPDYAYIIQKVSSREVGNNPVLIFDENNKQTIRIASTEITNQGNNSVFVYPNPASDVLYLNYDEAKLQNIKIELVNEMGQTVFLSTNTKRIDTKEFKAGLYILKFTSDAFSKSVKVAIQH